MSERVPRFGPEEISLRHRVDRLSLLVSASRNRADADTLADTVIRKTYPSILDGLNAMDRNRNNARKFRGEMTMFALNANEANAAFFLVCCEVCQDVLCQSMDAKL